MPRRRRLVDETLAKTLPTYNKEYFANKSPGE
jgi:hypothetical protein